MLIMLCIVTGVPISPATSGGLPAARHALPAPSVLPPVFGQVKNGDQNHLTF